MTTPYPQVKTRKPVGGFVFLTVQQLCLLWWVYRTRHIRLLDFRVWFAAHEMVARRCQIDAAQVPDYTPHELHRLVGGVGGAHLRASLRRLEGLRLLTWSSTALTFATSAADLRGIDDLSGFSTMHQAIVNNRRRVPVPRQAVRLIAGGLKASVIATMLGHLIRCLYYREQHCHSGGWCKASWIAGVFGIDLRSVKAARKHLVAIGWLQTYPTPQSLCNRWGTYTRISLSWTRAAMERAAENQATLPSASPPPPPFSTTQLPPLNKEDKEPLQERKHQEPVRQPDTLPHAATSRSAASTSNATLSGVHRQGDPVGKPSLLSPPSLDHIVFEDLHDTARLLALFEQAHTRGLIGTSASDRLTFLALAEHATVVGSRNPCGLFAALVHRHHWHFVTDSDEDAAHTRLKHYLYGTPARATPSPTLAPTELSQDATIVRYVQTQMARAGWQGDAFGLVSRGDSTWTRERWDRAAAELGQAQAAWQHANALTRLGDLTGVEDCLGILAGETPEEDVPE